MKNTKSSVKKEVRVEAPAASDQPINEFFGTEAFPNDIELMREEMQERLSTNRPTVDPFDTTLLGSGIPNYVLDPASFNKELPPLATPEQIKAMNKVYNDNKVLQTPTTEELRLQRLQMQAEKEGFIHNEPSVFYQGTGLSNGFKAEDAWIQTHSGRRFSPTNPNPNAIVIQDVAHALSMQCRFSGHCKKFYSVAQHSVLVSHICNFEDALWGLLHDASEAYLVDVPRPLKRSGKLQGYIDMELVMQEAVCRRFALPFKEPPSVKMADTILLATEARDLMAPLHSDWPQRVEPLPFHIDAWDQQKAKDMFMKRFFELTTPGESAKLHYEHYLRYKDQL